MNENKHILDLEREEIEEGIGLLEELLDKDICCARIEGKYLLRSFGLAQTLLNELRKEWLMIEPGRNIIMENIKEMEILKVKKLYPKAILPTKGTEDAAGLDLYSCVTEDIAHNDLKKIPTGIAVEIPKGYVGLLCSRSGMVAKTGIHVANQPGVIDADYRGEIQVLLQDAGTTPDRWPFEINPGDRIAQLVIVPVANMLIQEVEELDATVRGEGGFGSTGVK